MNQRVIFTVGYENPWPDVSAGGNEKETGYISKTWEQFEGHNKIAYGVST